MIIFENYIISDELVNEKFVCDLNKCKGACCVLGDAGAPLLEHELSILDDIYIDIKDFITPEGVYTIENQGKYVIDIQKEYSTPLVHGKQCAYAYTDDNKIARCSIEKAYEIGLVNFRKPASCFLYPIRISKCDRFDAINYHRWDICKTARKNGDKLNVRVFEFLKNPIIQNFGDDMYKMLCQLKLKQKK